MNKVFLVPDIGSIVSGLRDNKWRENNWDFAEKL